MFVHQGNQENRREKLRLTRKRSCPATQTDPCKATVRRTQTVGETWSTARNLERETGNERHAPGEGAGTH